MTPIVWKRARDKASEHRTWLDLLLHGDISVLHIGSQQIIFVSGRVLAIYGERSATLQVSNELLNAEWEDWRRAALKLTVPLYERREYVPQEYLDRCLAIVEPRK